MRPHIQSLHFQFAFFLPGCPIGDRRETGRGLPVETIRKMKEFDQFVVEVRKPAGHNVDDNNRYTLLEIRSDFCGKGSSSRGPILVCGADQLDCRHQVPIAIRLVDADLE
jgi:hypothetical protein